MVLLKLPSLTNKKFFFTWLKLNQETCDVDTGRVNAEGRHTGQEIKQVISSVLLP